MRVTITTQSKEELRSGRPGFYELEAKDEHDVLEININEGEPEDMNMERNLFDLNKIADLVMMAYEAGVRGEDIVIDE